MTAIISDDLGLFYSGDGTSTGSWGGAITANEISSSSYASLFSKVSQAESAAGDTDYICVYVKNSNINNAWEGVVLWFQQNTIGTDTLIELANGASVAGVSEQTIPNESTAPSSPAVTFSSPSTKATGISLGNIPANSYKSFWVKRIVNAASGASNFDNFILNIEGRTAGA